MEVIMQANELREYFQQGDEDQLKPSRYNYIEQGVCGCFIYNTLYSSLVYVTSQEYSEIIEGNPISKDMLHVLYNAGILVKRYLDERKAFLDMAKESREKNDSTFLCITTTMKCNARCHYCFEKNAKKTDFSYEQRKKLVDFIVKFLNKNQSKKLDICWFGGEPLLGQDVIDYVVDELNKRNINFGTTMITNGSLINKNLIAQKFNKWKLHSVQITLDGMAKTYRKTKNYINAKDGDFRQMLQNIRDVAEAGINVSIRLNVDQRNFDEILALSRMLEEEYRFAKGNISWYIGFVDGSEYNLTPEQKKDVIKRMYMQVYDEDGIGRLTIPNFGYRTVTCSRKNKNALSIDIDGNIYSCERSVGKEKEAMGTSFCVDDDVNEKRSVMNLSSKCMQCIFLPKCMGGCYAALRAGDELCFREKYIIQGYLEYLAEKQKKNPVLRLQMRRTNKRKRMRSRAIKMAVSMWEN